MLFILAHILVPSHLPNITPNNTAPINIQSYVQSFDSSPFGLQSFSGSSPTTNNNISSPPIPQNNDLFNKIQAKVFQFFLIILNLLIIILHHILSSILHHILSSILHHILSSIYINLIGS
jgi:hypothetical protein